MPGEVPEVVEPQEAIVSPDPIEIEAGSGDVATAPVRARPRPRGYRALARLQAVLALGVVVAAIVLITTTTLGQGASTATTPAAPALKISFHHVLPGDSLETIAARYHSTVAILEQLNPTLNPQDLVPGSVLRVGSTTS